MSADAIPPTLGELERQVLVEFRVWLSNRFGDRLKELRLFGSRARGEGHEDSDLDVLTVVEGLTPREQREVWEHTGDLLTKFDVIVGGLTLSTSAWQDLRARERNIVREIDRDGVSL